MGSLHTFRLATKSGEVQDLTPRAERGGKGSRRVAEEVIGGVTTKEPRKELGVQRFRSYSLRLSRFLSLL